MRRISAGFPARALAACALASCALAACASSSSRSTWERADDERADSLPADKLAGESATVRGATLLQDTEALIRWLREHNRALAAERARVRQAKSELDQVELLPNPVLDLGWNGINVGRRNPAGASWSESQNYAVGVQETIELGKRGPRIESARLRLDAARHSYFDVIGDRTSTARGALGRAVYLQAKAGVLEESLASARQVLALEQTRLQHGDISGNDFDRLTLDTSLLELEQPQLRAELEAAVASVRAALGAEYALESVDVSVLADAAKVPDAPGDLNAALARRPDLVALERAVSSARQDALLAERRTIPDPIVGVSYTHDNFTVAGNIPDSAALTVGFALPIFDQGQHEQAKAESHASELAQTRGAALQQARADVSSLLAKKSTLDGVLRTLRGTAIPKSQQVLDTTLSAFNRGQLSLTDLLLARRTHTDLLLKTMDLEFEAFGVRNDLRHALGLDAELAQRLDGGVSP